MTLGHLTQPRNLKHGRRMLTPLRYLVIYNEFMKVFTIIAGVNGTGKSSLIGLAASIEDLGIRIDTEKIVTAHDGDVLPDGEKTLRLIDQSLEQELSFTQETTLSGHKTENTIRKARKAGYHIRLFYIGLDDLDEHLKRIANRVAKGGHDIPVQTVIRRFKERFNALAKVLPLCDEAFFYDNHNGFVEVAEYRNGKFTLKNGYKPKWLSELINTLDS